MPVTALVTPAGGDKADADTLAGARIRIRRMYGRLLVPNQHVLELVLFEYLVVDIEHGAAGIAEHKVDFFFRETANDDFRASNGLWHFLPQEFANLHKPRVGGY